MDNNLEDLNVQGAIYEIKVLPSEPKLTEQRA